MALNQEPLDLEDHLIPYDYDYVDGTEHIYVNGKLIITAEDLAEGGKYSDAQFME